MFLRFIAITAIFSFVLLFVSCDKQRDDQPFSEKEKIIKLMKDYGFEEVKSSNARSSTGIANAPIHTVEEAKAYLEQISKLNGLTQDLDTTPKRANGRLRFVACEDQGTYYISRAIEPFALSSVEVRYERNSSGELINIVSYSTGWNIVGWDHIGTNVFDPKKEFCIDGVMTYGIDIEGVPLGYRAPMSLRVKLYGAGCTAIVTSQLGHC